VRYAGTPAMITAIANGELEIAELSYPSLPIAIQNAGLDDLRVIADEFQDGVEGYYTNEYFVLKDSTIQKVEDLKGKVVASNAAGSAVDITMRAMLRKHGLEDKRDYTLIETPFPTMRSMLTEKKVDLISGVIPFSLDPEMKKIARPLFTGMEAVGTTQFAMFVARKAFIDKNRAAMVDAMEDILRITRWYLDPANHKEAIEIAGRAVKMPPERLDWAFTKKDYYRNPDMIPNLEALQKNIDTTHRLGFIPASFDVKKYVDLSVIEEAVKRLK
jgi:sulfonate transport system substrate-binding protein